MLVFRTWFHRLNGALHTPATIEALSASTDLRFREPSRTVSPHNGPI